MDKHMLIEAAYIPEDILFVCQRDNSGSDGPGGFTNA